MTILYQLIYSMIIFGFITITSCIFFSVLYSLKGPNSESFSVKGIMTCVFLFICISGACLLFVDDFIFSNLIFVLMIISCIVPCLFVLKKKERQINYNYEDEALITSVNYDPPSYGKN